MVERQRSAYEPKYIIFCANQIKKLNTIVGLGLFKTVYPINLINQIFTVKETYQNKEISIYTISECEMCCELVD